MKLQLLIHLVYIFSWQCVDRWNWALVQWKFLSYRSTVSLSFCHLMGTSIHKYLKSMSESCWMIHSFSEWWPEVRCPYRNKISKIKEIVLCKFDKPFSGIIQKLGSFYTFIILKVFKNILFSCRIFEYMTLSVALLLVTTVNELCYVAGFTDSIVTY
jgi:hypothetical protein